LDADRLSLTKEDFSPPSRFAIALKQQTTVSVRTSARLVETKGASAGGTRFRKDIAEKEWNGKAQQSIPDLLRSDVLGSVPIAGKPSPIKPNLPPHRLAASRACGF
jgi:hypothetical protein